MLRLPNVPYFETILHRVKDMLKQHIRSFLYYFSLINQFQWNPLVCGWVLTVYVRQT